MSYVPTAPDQSHTTSKSHNEGTAWHTLCSTTDPVLEPVPQRSRSPKPETRNQDQLSSAAGGYDNAASLPTATHDACPIVCCQNHTPASVTMELRERIKERFARTWRKQYPSFESQSLDEAHPSPSPPKTSRTATRRTCSPAPVSHRTTSPLPAILKKKSRLSFIRRRKGNSTSRKVAHNSDPMPQPKCKEAKKEVRFSLPDKKVSVRPAQSVSTHCTERKRSTTTHPKAETRPSKRVKYPEPVVVAQGLSTATRSREAERPKEMAKAKAKALAGHGKQRTPTATASTTPKVPRFEKRTKSYPYAEYQQKKLSNQLRPRLALEGYDWAKVTTKRVYGWYK